MCQEAGASPASWHLWARRRRMRNSPSPLAAQLCRPVQPGHAASETLHAGKNGYPGRDMITIRKEIVRNGLYSAGHDRDRNGLAGGRWRCDGMVRRAFADRGGCAGRAHRGAVGRDRGRPARDRHAGAPRLRRARRGGVGGRVGSRADRESCRAAAPERRVRVREPDRGEAVLAARVRLRAWGGRRLADPLRRDPAIRIRRSTEPRPLRNRIHLDVVRPAAAVEQASLGQASGPFGVCHTDPDGNEVDLVPGDALTERIATADWQAVFSAMACYRITSPAQQRDLVAAVAALADDAGFPLLIDLRPGLVIIDSGKDQSEDDAHGFELDFTDLAGNLQTAARELGATADPGLPRFAQLFLDAADVAAVRAFWVT